MLLSEWISAVGGRRRASILLRVTPETIHYWLAGKSSPELKTIIRIVNVSEGRVSMREILEETKFRSRLKVSRETFLKVFA